MHAVDSPCFSKSVDSSPHQHCWRTDATTVRGVVGEIAMSSRLESTSHCEGLRRGALERRVRTGVVVTFTRILFRVQRAREAEITFLGPLRDALQVFAETSSTLNEMRCYYRHRKSRSSTMCSVSWLQIEIEGTHIGLHTCHWLRSDMQPRVNLIIILRLYRLDAQLVLELSIRGWCMEGVSPTQKITPARE